jgi:hypothetical protein
MVQVVTESSGVGFQSELEGLIQVARQDGDFEVVERVESEERRGRREEKWRGERESRGLVVGGRRRWQFGACRIYYLVVK